MGANAQTKVPTFASAEVLTAANTNLLSNGIPVFSGTATRDAAFGGSGEKVLAEGQFAYLEDSNTTQYYDGTVWATVGPTSLTPMIPTSVAVGSGSASVSSVGTVTFTGCSSISVNGCFTTSFTSYNIIYNAITIGGTASIGVRLRASGTDNSSANYANATSRVPFATGALANFANGATDTRFFIGDNDTDGRTGYKITICNPMTADKTNATFQGTSQTYRFEGGMNMTVTTAYDGITFTPNANTITGTILIGGYNQ